VSRMTDLVGRVLSGRYRLTAPIGAGASAQVFLAEDARLRRRVAVKLLHAGLADDEGFLRRFRAEAQAAAALNHPHIVAVYDWGDDEGTPYLVTELLSGGSLRGMLDAGHRMSPSQALLIGLEATRALEHAHRRGFVHRDIKPANLLFGEEGRLRIADFGLARALAEAAWTEPAGAVVGTARYASPEQARGESVDGRGDVYALGLTLIEAVTGRVPFAADTTIGTLMARIDTPVEVPAALGPLRRALTRAGLPDAEERPDAGEFGVALMAAAEELPRPAPFPLVGATPALLGEGPSSDPTMYPGATSVPAVGADATAVTATAVPPPPPTTGSSLYDLADEDEPAPAADEPPRKKRIWLRVLLGVLLLAALAGGGYVAAQTLLVPSHEVPEFVSLDQATAEALAEENGWEVVLREDREDGSTPGEVLRQDPPPGESLEEGEEVTLTVSLGQQLRAVPTDLAGLPLPEALVRLEAAGLTAGEPQRTFDEAVALDGVIGLAEGTPPDVESGTAIVLVVSDGPAPRAVPSLPAGTTPADACVAVEAVQLVCSQQEVFSDTVPAGQVVGTEPAAGTEVPRDSTVVVQISKGPEFIPVPNVSGMSVADATATLQQAGLVVEVLPAGATGQVIVTDPLPGEQVRRNTAVSVFARRN
jgi:serine/threonine protein kinase/beta-lactam-binding protein with PASTA domain